MSDCNSSCGCPDTSCPSPASVTIQNTYLQLDGKNYKTYVETLTPAEDANGNLVATLTHAPYEAADVQITLNGIVQVQGANYTINVRQVYLGKYPTGATGLKWVARYKYNADGSTLTVEAGVTMSSLASSIPTGWLLCNGAAVAQATYAALFAAIGHDFANDEDDETALEAAGNFRLPNLKDIVQDPSGNQYEVNKLIKT